MRSIRRAALGATLLALLVGACTSGGGSPTPAATTPAPATPAPSESAAPTPVPASLASTLVLGGPPECPQRPFCAVGLGKTYGLTFKEFRPLDAGGPITVEAVRNGQVDVGLLFTSDPAIAANGFVLLADDKQLQLADNLVPVLRQAVLDATPAIADLLNGWTAKLTQETLTDLNKQVSVDQKEPKDVVKAWLDQAGLTTATAGAGKTVTVGSTNFYEQEVLGELFAQVLEADGFAVERKFQLGNREIVFPALEAGEIDILAEYAATALEYVNGGAGEASTDPAATVAKLRERLAPKGLTALDPAPATDQNGFVVTKATAEEYGITNLSDLAKPAP
jgi:glycine betaine/choline ABC-type transport system substrate-binding protein